MSNLQTLLNRGENLGLAQYSEGVALLLRYEVDEIVPRDADKIRSLTTDDATPYIYLHDFGGFIQVSVSWSNGCVTVLTYSDLARALQSFVTRLVEINDAADPVVAELREEAYKATEVSGSDEDEDEEEFIEDDEASDEGDDDELDEEGGDEAESEVITLEAPKGKPATKKYKQEIASMAAQLTEFFPDNDELNQGMWVEILNSLFEDADSVELHTGVDIYDQLAELGVEFDED